MEPKPPSPIIFVLKGLMPYTRENIMLSFSPHRFFNELEKISNYKRRTFEEAARRAEQQKLIEKQADLWKLTLKGQKMVKPFTAKKLSGDSKLMIVFDVPEDRAKTRTQFRRILSRWGFHQLQKSVWLSEYDQREVLAEVIEELELQGYVKLFECVSFSTKK